LAISDHVILFVKDPAFGVKTRLASAIGTDRAVELYRLFVEDMAGLLGHIPGRHRIAYTPLGSKSVFQDWLGPNFEYLPQRGEDLGERMENAFTDAFAANHEKVLLMGSDLPGFPLEGIQRAFSALDRRPCVFCPTPDGGYCLVGFSRGGFQPGIFHGIEWSTSTVLSETLRRLAPGSFELLPGFPDVDTVDDLAPLRARMEALGPRGAAIRAALERAGFDS
jgi:hypothetical protein